MKKNDKCPFLEEIVVRYCKAYPVRKMIPTNKLLREDPCIGCPSKCSIYNEVAHINNGNNRVLKPSSVGVNFSCNNSNTEFVRGFLFDASLLYLANHIWLNIEENKYVKIGIDDFAQKILGSISQIYVMPDGELISKISVNHLEQNIDITVPITGKIIASNHEVIANPELIAEDPYHNWIYFVEALGLETTLENSLAGIQAKNWLESEVNALQELLQVECASGVADGGELVSDWQKRISPAQQQKLRERFLLKWKK